MTELTADVLKTLPEGRTEWDDEVKGFGALGLKRGAGKKARASFVFRYRLGGTRRYKVFGEWPAMTLTAARARAYDYRTAVRDGLDPFAVEEPEETEQGLTYAEAVKDYHRRYQVGEIQAATADATLGELLRHGAAWADLPVASITPVMVGKLLDGIRDGGERTQDGGLTAPRAATANKMHALLTTFFSWCMRAKVRYVTTSPIADVEKPAPNRRPPPPRPASPDELGALWRAAHPKGPLGRTEAAYIRAALLTGKRKSKLAAMRRDEIGQVAGMAVPGWWGPKNAKLPAPGVRKLHLPIPLSAPALRTIAALPPVIVEHEGKAIESPYVFASTDPRYPDSPIHPGTKLKDALRKAAKKDVPSAAEWTYHHARDTIATRLEELGCPGNVARQLTDHVQSTDAHQRAYTAADLAEACEDWAEAWGRYVLLCGSRRRWGFVSAWLRADDVADLEARRLARRARRREFNAAIQSQAEWRALLRRAVREVARREPAPPPSKPEAPPRLRLVAGTAVTGGAS